MSRLGCSALALVLTAAWRPASAGNDRTPRTPPVWIEPGCATLVDRSTTPVVHFDYFVPEDDDEPEDDEPVDSRSHQFFAFARLDFAASSGGLPNWISDDDVARAAQADVDFAGDIAEYPIDPEDVLESTSRFSEDEWLRITADDARVPITAEQAELGVDWDISIVPAGSYVVHGYTWEPDLNLWSPRPGFVKVIASAAEADAAGPAIALLREHIQLAVGEAHPLPGCVHAPEGSMLTLEWGPLEGSLEPEWRPLIEDAPIAAGTLGIDFVPPAAAAHSASVKLRATVTDPSGRQYVAYSPGSYAVLGDDTESCGCTQTRPSRPAVVLFALAGLVGLRRRRGGATLRS